MANKLVESVQASGVTFTAGAAGDSKASSPQVSIHYSKGESISFSIFDFENQDDIERIATGSFSFEVIAAMYAMALENGHKPTKQETQAVLASLAASSKALN